MNTLEDLQKEVVSFRDQRDWKQFHNPKDLALSLVLESAEVMEHFQWKQKDEAERYINENREAIGGEMADVLYWLLLMSEDLKIDLGEAFLRKMEKNNQKYSVEKASGNHKKYTEL